MRRVLIVDSDKYAAVKLSFALRKCGCQVEWVETVPKAVNRMKEVDFACVILDVQVNDTHGYEAIPVIREISPDTEIIATTSENSKELEARTREQGVFYYYIKPSDPDELRSAVENVFEKAKRAKEHGCFPEKRRRKGGITHGCEK